MSTINDMMNENSKPAIQLKVLQVIAGAIITGALLFTIVTQVITDPSIEPDDSTESMFMLIAIPLMAVSLIGGYSYSSRKIRQIEKDNPLKKKLAVYSTATIIRMATAEGPLLFMLVAYLITGSSNFLWLSVICWIMFVIGFPRRQKVIDELGLSYNEKEELEGKGID